MIFFELSSGREFDGFFAEHDADALGHELDVAGGFDSFLTASISLSLIVRRAWTADLQCR